MFDLGSGSVPGRRGRTGYSLDQDIEEDKEEKPESDGSQGRGGHPAEEYGKEDRQGEPESPVDDGDQEEEEESPGFFRGGGTPIMRIPRPETRRRMLVIMIPMVTTPAANLALMMVSR